MSDEKTEHKAQEPTPAEKPAEAVAAAPSQEGAKPSAPPVKAILARKIGMTRVYTPTGEFIPVTVLEAGPCPVVQVKTKDNDGYDAIQLAFDPAKPKNVLKPETGHFAKASVPPMRCVREVRLPKTDGFQAGQEIRVGNFVAGDIVDVSGVNKGKGFAGAMKRHRFHGGPRTHGQSDRARAPGSSGGQRPQRVLKGVQGPGHMGAEWSTVQRLEVVRVDAEDNLLLIHGSVPGPNGTYLTVRQTTRPGKVAKVSVPAKPAAKKADAKAGGKAPAKAAPAKAPAKK
jgi:large subunit ribosomal protein L3